MTVFAVHVVLVGVAVEAAVPLEEAPVDEAAFAAFSVTTPYEVDELEDVTAHVSFALGRRTGAGRSGSSIFTSTSRRGRSTGTGRSGGTGRSSGRALGTGGSGSRGRSRIGERVLLRLGGDLEGVFRLSSLGPGWDASPILVASGTIW